MITIALGLEKSTLLMMLHQNCQYFNSLNSGDRLKSVAVAPADCDSNFTQVDWYQIIIGVS